jgi:8-oxo-dGTP diphosphatase
MTNDRAIPTAPSLLPVVAAAMVDLEGRVLLQQRPPGKSLAGLWEFPGGKLEEGEAPASAIVREIHEELGVVVHVTGHLTTDDTVVGSRIIRLICLLCGLDGPRPQWSSDHDLLEWAAPASLSARDWATPDLPAVRLLTEAV